MGTQGSALHQTHLCCHCLQLLPVIWVCPGQWLLPGTLSGFPSSFLSSLVPAHLSALPAGPSTGLEVHHTLFLLLASMKVPCSDMGWFDLFSTTSAGSRGGSYPWLVGIWWVPANNQPSRSPPSQIPGYKAETPEQGNPKLPHGWGWHWSRRPPAAEGWLCT